MTIRKAKVTEAKDIKRLIDFYSLGNSMLSRTLDNIYATIRDFTVAIDNNLVIGICALTVFTEELAEIRSLAVDEKYHGNGVGKKLVIACIEEASTYDIKKIFTLTYVSNFFKKLNFVPIDKHNLPNKIWRDCLNCEHFYNCDEDSLIYYINKS